MVRKSQTIHYRTLSYRQNINHISHLPDITIITPVFAPNSDEIIFFTASRGHHADVGGILPGSMPPTSVSIFEEGAEIVSFKIVNNGVFDRDKLYELMIDKPGSYPGSSGCRNIKDVESDLKAVSIHLLYPYQPCAHIPPANCGQPQRHPTNSSKCVALPFATLLYHSWVFSGERIRTQDCPGIHVPYPLQCRAISAKLTP